MTTKHQLDQLIEGVKSANGWSDPDLVTNAEERGHVLSKSNISRMRNPLVSIKAEIVFALAAGLRVSPGQVAIAAVESMGIALPNYESPTPEQSVRLDTTLSVKDKGVVLALLQQLRSPTAATPPKSRKAKEVSRTHAKPGWSVDDDVASFPDGSEDEQHGTGL